jgi:hypothetical protein
MSRRISASRRSKPRQRGRDTPWDRRGHGGAPDSGTNRVRQAARPLLALLGLMTRRQHARIRACSRAGAGSTWSARRSIYRRRVDARGHRHSDGDPGRSFAGDPDAVVQDPVVSDRGFSSSRTLRHRSNRSIPEPHRGRRRASWHRRGSAPRGKARTELPSCIRRTSPARGARQSCADARTCCHTCHRRRRRGAWDRHSSSYRSGAPRLRTRIRIPADDRCAGDSAEHARLPRCGPILS